MAPRYSSSSIGTTDEPGEVSPVMHFNHKAGDKLFAMLKTSKADGPYVKQINKLEKQGLLILDDFGLKGLDNTYRHSFMGNHRRLTRQKVNN